MTELQTGKRVKGDGGLNRQDIASLDRESERRAAIDRARRTRHG